MKTTILIAVLLPIIALANEPVHDQMIQWVVSHEPKDSIYYTQKVYFSHVIDGYNHTIEFKKDMTLLSALRATPYTSHLSDIRFIICRSSGNLSFYTKTEAEAGKIEISPDDVICIAPRTAPN
ncbi:MAG: hypothetical protein JF599_11530 [Verrucomicrobia bacterium]|nr:hypothetical protein [Verrucomicrobiota bacterium]